MVNGRSQVFGWTEEELYGIDRCLKGLEVMDSEHWIMARSPWACSSRACSHRVTADSCKSGRLRQKIVAYVFRVSLKIAKYYV